MNERPIKKIEAIFEEVKTMDALGASMTGGDPLERIDRTINFIRALKSRFNKEFHVHLYTAKSKIVDKDLNKLVEAGLDEIRFHLMNETIKPAILKAREYSWQVGVEIPVFPDNKAFLQNTAEFCGNYELDFLILNELEFSESNTREMKKTGYRPLSNFSFTVLDSAKIGRELVGWISENLGINVHFCSANVKDGVQFRQRLIRTARKTARPFHEITEDGLILTGVVEGDEHQLESLSYRLENEWGVPPELFEFNKEKKRLETRWDIMEALKSELEREGYQIAIIEQYPTWDRSIVSRIPL